MQLYKLDILYRSLFSSFYLYCFCSSVSKSNDLTYPSGQKSTYTSHVRINKIRREGWCQKIPIQKKRKLLRSWAKRKFYILPCFPLWVRVKTIVVSSVVFFFLTQNPSAQEAGFYSKYLKILVGSFRCHFKANTMTVLLPFVKSSSPIIELPNMLLSPILSVLPLKKFSWTNCLLRRVMQYKSK